MDQFLLMNLHPVLILDAALSSHPIVQEVQNPDQITEIFDTISYDKVCQFKKVVNIGNFKYSTKFYLIDIFVLYINIEY